MFALLMMALLYAADAYTLVSGEWNGEQVEFASGRAILSVTSDSGFVALDSLLTAFSAVKEEEISELRMYFITFPELLSVIVVCAEFDKDPNTAYCEPDLAMYAASDRFWQWQWGFQNRGDWYGGRAGADMMVKEAHSLNGTSNVKIAIIDTGIPANNDTINPVFRNPDLGGDDMLRFEMGRMCYERTDSMPHTWTTLTDTVRGVSESPLRRKMTTESSGCARVARELSRKLLIP